MVDMTPPLTQTIRERQEAVKAVASLGHGGAASPHRTESLSEQDSAPDEISCSSQDTAEGLPRITPGTSDEIICHTKKDIRMPMRKPEKNGWMVYNESRTVDVRTGNAGQLNRSRLRPPTMIQQSKSHSRGAISQSTHRKYNRGMGTLGRRHMECNT
ncbi:hypothetical protein NDU88_007062 [Pleurodeles waltl]|uniref:Uncharacterized protein n=1 Tax=Pleurodeles waltl TaxID=8319 RepID=A0AAV7RSZ6_PLEWA|nr:hypothetical protein NDU88_007062 [Pleurodeles waltl]